MEKQSGNVLFIILIAVALFAALSYAVTQSNRSGGGDVSAETLKLEVSTILQFATFVENSIIRMKISNRCEDSQISFETPEVTSSANTSGTPADNSCKVFHPAGGGASYLSAKSEWLIPDPGGLTPHPLGSFYSGYGELTFVTQNLVTGVGYDSCLTSITNCPGGEVLMIIPFVNDSLCAAFNEKQNIVGTTYNLYGRKYTGEFYIGQTLPNGQRTACLTTASNTAHYDAGTNIIYHVVMPR